MRKFLIKKFIKNYEDVRDPSVRKAYGKLAGFVGIISNTFLCVMKLFVGFLFGSIAIIADGINNLTDASSSVITLIGFKLAAIPEDDEHPYGHARIEYLTGVFVSVLIIVLGVKLFTSSFSKILHPEPLTFSYITILVLIIAILVKIWQCKFNLKTGEEIGSSTLKATGLDSRNDVIATSAVLLSIIFGKITGFQLDGYMGCLVALFILFSGIQLIRETAGPLLGQAPDPELVSEIKTRIMENEGVLGIHDLAVHDYGPGRIFASVHIEVDAHGNIMASHDLIDNIERSIKHDLKIQLVAHMDPIDTKDPLTQELKILLQDTIKTLDGVLSIHDLRIVSGYTHTNVIFDVVLTANCKLKTGEIKETIEKKLREKDPKLNTIIVFDTNYANIY